MKHIIRKQLIDLEIDVQLDAFDIQQEMSALFWNYMLPLIEKVFDEICGENEVFIIDKIEIELGDLTVDDLKDKNEISIFLDALVQQLSDKLRNLQTEGIHAERKMISWNVFRQWLFYMEHGFLPWNADKPDEYWYGQVLESIAVEYEHAEALRMLIRNRDLANERIVLQHPTIYLVHLTELLTAQTQKLLPEYLEEISLFLSFCHDKGITVFLMHKRDFQVYAWKQILHMAALPHAKLTSDQLAARLLQLFIPLEAWGQQSEQKFPSRKLKLILPVIKNLQRLNAKRDYKNYTERVQNKQSALEKKPGEINAGTEVADKSNSDNQEKEKKNKIKSETYDSDDKPDQTELSIEEIAKTDEAVFIGNAGLVLLGPFIYPFFRNLNLLTEGKFTDVFKHQKSLCLLHYLATGRKSAAEHELVIPKILTAFPINLVADQEMILSMEEANEADLLLQEVIAQWNILKSTSPDGMREGFLQRPGKLFRNDDHFCLQMETSSIDVLLDYLPWNLSVIKLPWMKERLIVEWRR